ncbi:MAG: spermidine/putrescine ABC transporter substrate-binding protein, partial [Deltaproteobacteria bacterium]|nr:spermidine/putrescine ABC transporter substrate-binding protein [Deltaproteobacteria bacterium]
ARLPTRRTLAVYNWGDYLAPELIERFTEHMRAQGQALELVQDFFLAEAELQAKLRAGAAYDIALPIDYLLSSMQREGLLQLLDPPLAGIEHLAADMQPWQASPERGGGVYGIPYLWGTTGIGYDSERVEPPTSWNALFDPHYAGRISVIDSKGDVMDQALLAAGLGINSTDKAKIRDEVWPRLREQKQLLRAYDSNPAAALIEGQTWIAQIDSGDLLRAQKQRPSLRYVIPDEGAALWVDYLVIPASAREPAAARAFIEFMLVPEHAAINANFLRFATPNRSALERGLIADAGDAQLYPPPEVRAKLFVSENWDGGTKELVDELWLELRSG